MSIKRNQIFAIQLLNAIESQSNGQFLGNIRLRSIGVLRLIAFDWLNDCILGNIRLSFDCVRLVRLTSPEYNLSFNSPSQSPKKLSIPNMQLKFTTAKICKSIRFTCVYCVLSQMFCSSRSNLMFTNQSTQTCQWFKNVLPFSHFELCLFFVMCLWWWLSIR